MFVVWLCGTPTDKSPTDADLHTQNYNKISKTKNKTKNPTKIDNALSKSLRHKRQQN